MEGAPPASAAHLGWARLGASLVTKPRLWPTAMRQARLLSAPEWRRFRMETQYGRPDGALDAADAMAWLEWCRSWRQSVPRRRRPRKRPSPARVQG
ncbi:MAG TPA: hypothetical protein VKD67_04540 [Acidimicrobiales bacterium]|jgi:hypothetical protein|nr:hypothetical protein [Acidimicrobiales bacterium]